MPVILLSLSQFSLKLRLTPRRRDDAFYGWPPVWRIAWGNPASSASMVTRIFCGTHGASGQTAEIAKVTLALCGRIQRSRPCSTSWAASQSGMATLAVPIHDAEEVFNPNAVKVVMDKDGYALYFSRAAIPWDRDRFAKSREQIGDTFLRHIGIYGYRAGFIRRYVNWAPSPLEHIEMLEQLRVLWYGEKIHVAVAKEVPGTGVDTPEDLARVRAEMK